MSEATQVVLSGIRATGRMHLGNYLGVLEQFARLSRDRSKHCYFFVADLHTLTTHKEAALIRSQAPQIVRDMLAAGVDPEQATIYIQSQVPVVTELAWYLSCLTSAGDLTRMPTFKDKAEKHADDVNAGLLFYPVLMSADILGPRANFVPVGKDQTPHLELTRELARRFNRLYGEYFPIPNDLGEDMLSVPGLVAQDSDGRFAKMGKSEAPEQTLYLNETALEHEQKLRVAPTDPARVRRADPGTPSKCVIFSMHDLINSNERLQQVAKGCRTAGIGCKECKKELATVLCERLRAFRERREELLTQPDNLTNILTEGAVRARAVFEETTAHVADRMGVFRPGSVA